VRIVIKASTLILSLTAMPCVAQIAKPAEQSDTLQILAAALTTAMPEFEIIVDEDDLSILIKRTGEEVVHVYPDNLHLSLSAASSDEERQTILNDFVRVAADVDARQSVADPIDTSKILPVIRDSFVLDQVGPNFIPYRAFEEGLVIYWVVDSNTAMKSVSNEDLAALDLSPTDIESIALKNMALKAADLERIEVGEFTMVTLDGYYESSLLLVPGLWQDFDATMGTVVVAPIARDFVLVADADIPGQTTLLADIATEQWAKSAYPITAKLFVWEADHWSILRN
jgi:uncharacterized protein YtpQ (UPF0354 family)